MNKKPKLLYILSPSYSGSTLLTFLLANHPMVATLGELKASSLGPIEQYVCSCGKPILRCGFWTRMVSVANEKNISFDLSDFGTNFRSPVGWKDRIMESQIRGPLFEVLRELSINCAPSLKHDFQRILSKNEALIDICMELQGGTLFLDGSKDPHRLKYILNADIWDVYVIEMVRDGRAQSNSARSKVTENLNFAQACKEWVYTINQMNKVRKYIHINRHLAFHYEELCANPNVVINGIWEFLDLPQIDQDWSNVDLEGGSHHILGNDNMRKAPRIMIKLDEKWREQVTQEELDIFEKLAGSVNRRLGYK